MNKTNQPVLNIRIWCFLLCLVSLLFSGCSIRVGNANSSRGESADVRQEETNQSASSQIEESSTEMISEAPSSSILSSEESEYFSILDYIPEHKKHFLQKKDRKIELEESSEEESSEEESMESEESKGEESSAGPFFDDNQTKYLIRINKTTNVATVYSKDRFGNHTIPVRSMICSTGTTTPIGTFMMGYQSRWKGLAGGQWAQYVSHISGDFLMQSVPYRKKSPDSMVLSSYNTLGTTGTTGSVYLTVADAYWVYMNCDAYNTLIQIGFFGTTDPWGKPSVIRIPASQTINWDPSDPGDGNPWNTKMPSFTGIKDYTIYVGESTPDLTQNVRGYDTCGNDQTGLIRISGSVNGFVPGTYTVTYYLTDVLGRTGIRKAYVTVQTKPENSRPESTRPESSRPESSRPESSRPESSLPESTRPESSYPEDSKPESSNPESSEPEASIPNDSHPESIGPDSSEMEGSGSEISNPDSWEEISSNPEDSYTNSSEEEFSRSEDLNMNSSDETENRIEESSENVTSSTDLSEEESLEPEVPAPPVISEMDEPSVSSMPSEPETEESKKE